MSSCTICGKAWREHTTACTTSQVCVGCQTRFEIIHQPLCLTCRDQGVREGERERLAALFEELAVDPDKAVGFTPKVAASFARGAEGGLDG